MYHIDKTIANKQNQYILFIKIKIINLLYI